MHFLVLNFILGEFGGGTGGEPEEEAVLSLGNAITSGTSNVVLPLNIYSTDLTIVRDYIKILAIY